ncbi:MAG: hypothetical protein ACR2RV_00895 [Verrucomicrobiales bacterium]
MRKDAMSKQTSISTSNSEITRNLGTWQIVIAGVALVVAVSTLVTDFTGFSTLGGALVVLVAALALTGLSIATGRGSRAEPAPVLTAPIN